MTEVGFEPTPPKRLEPDELNQSTHATPKSPGTFPNELAISNVYIEGPKKYISEPNRRNVTNKKKELFKRKEEEECQTSKTKNVSPAKTPLSKISVRFLGTPKNQD